MERMALQVVMKHVVKHSRLRKGAYAGGTIEVAEIDLVISMEM